MNHSTILPASDEVGISLAALSTACLATEKQIFDIFSLIQFGLNRQEVVYDTISYRKNALIDDI